MSSRQPLKYAAIAAIVGLFTALGLALSSSPAAVAGPVCTQPAENCQSPDQLGHGASNTSAAVSDTNPNNPDEGAAIQDNFVVDAGGTVNAVCWWGIYVDFTAFMDCGPGTGDQFTVTYFEDIPGYPGVPGAVKDGPFTEGVDLVVTKAATGNIVTIGNLQLAEYGFSATHPDVTVAAGERVWIEIQNNTSGSCSWFWTTAPSAAEVPPGNGDGFSWQSGLVQDYDLAFCLNEPLGLVNPDCVGATNPCDMESGTPGCADPACCTLVCETPGLAFCCVNAWIAQCVAAVADVCALPAGCGVPGTGDCFADNGSAFCNDNCGKKGECPGCCETVCAVDPFCCATDWDNFCVDEAIAFCGCQPEDVPASDDCVDAVPIGLGEIVVSNNCATPECFIDPECDDPDHTSCGDTFVVGMGLDVWFSHTAEFTGPLLILPMPDDPVPGGPAAWSPQLGIYEGCDCAALTDPPFGCSQEGDPAVVPVVEGNCYLIRLGGRFDGPSGTGTLSLLPVPAACDNGIGDCLTANGSVGCSDLLCCATVCLQDPNCCDVDWDQTCADLGTQICQPLPCGAIDVSEATVTEPEPCLVDLDDDTFNGGCNSDPPVFTDIVAGDIIHGTASTRLIDATCDIDDDCADMNCVGDPNPGDGIDEGTCVGVTEPSVNVRDTDWYRITVTEEDDVDGDGLVDIHNNVVAELPILSFVLVDLEPVCLGDTDAPGDMTAYGQSCVQVNPGVATVAAPGDHYVFAAPGSADGGGIFDGFACPAVGPPAFGENYLLCVSVTDDGVAVDPTCPPSPCPWDCDGSGDGAVNVSDLLALLAGWDVTNPPCDGGGACDYDGNGCVEIADLLKLLAHFDPAGIGCP